MNIIKLQKKIMKFTKLYCYRMKTEQDIFLIKIFNYLCRNNDIFQQ